MPSYLHVFLMSAPFISTVVPTPTDEGSAGGRGSWADGAVGRDSLAGRVGGADGWGSWARQLGGAAERGRWAGQLGGAGGRGGWAGQVGGAAGRGRWARQVGGAGGRGSWAGQLGRVAGPGSRTGQSSTPSSRVWRGRFLQQAARACVHWSRQRRRASWRTPARQTPSASPTRAPAPPAAPIPLLWYVWAARGRRALARQVPSPLSTPSTRCCSLRNERRRTGLHHSR